MSDAEKLEKYRKMLAGGLIDEEEFQKLTAGLDITAAGDRAAAVGGDVRDSAIVTGDVEGDVVMPGGQKPEGGLSIGDVEGDIHGSTIAGRDVNITHIINHYCRVKC